MEKTKNRFVVLKKRTAKIKIVCIAIAWLSLCACLITSAVYPNLLSKVTGLCLVAFVLMFGWYLGLKDAYKSQMDFILPSHQS